MKHYITLLSNEPLLRQLSIIQLIAYFGAWFSNVAIYTLLIQMDVNPIIIALTASFHFLPGVLQAPFSGVLIDRFAPKRLMLILILVEIIGTLPLMLIDSIDQLWLLFLLVFIRMGASSFYFTLEMSLLPRILKAKDLKLANEIHSVIWSFSYTFGMAISGFVVYIVGVKIAFLLDALLFVIVFIMLFSILFPVEPERYREGYWKMMKESFVYLKSNPIIIHLILLHSFVGFTAFDALVALIVDIYYAPFIAAALGIGLLHSSRAIGLVIGPIIFGKLMNNRRLSILLIFQALSIFIWAIVMENFYLSMFVSVIVGLWTTTLWSYTYTLLQFHTDEIFYGRIVAYNDMIFLLSVSLVSLLIGILAENDISLKIITSILGFGFVIGVIYYEWIKKRFILKEINL